MPHCVRVNGEDVSAAAAISVSVSVSPLLLGLTGVERERKKHLEIWFTECARTTDEGVDSRELGSRGSDSGKR